MSSLGLQLDTAAIEEMINEAPPKPLMQEQGL